MFSGLVLPVADGMTLESAREALADGRGNLLIADGRRVRLMTAADRPTTIAGDGSFGYRGDGAAAVSAVLNGPSGLAVDRDGNVFIADTRNHRVRRVSTAGAISTLAGTGQPAATPKDYLRSLDERSSPHHRSAVDPSGGLGSPNRLARASRRLSPSGTILTIAGNGTAGFRRRLQAKPSARNCKAPGAGGSRRLRQSLHRRQRQPPHPQGDRHGPYASPQWPERRGGASPRDGGQASQSQLSQPAVFAFDSAGTCTLRHRDNRVRRVTLARDRADRSQRAVLWGRS